MEKQNFVKIYRKGGFFMYKIDELITEVHSTEAIELPSGLKEEQRERIEKQVFMSMKSRRYFPMKKRTIVMLAAVLVLVLGLTSFAAKQNEWDIVLAEFMGMKEKDIHQLEGGEVIIDKTIISECIDYANTSRGEKKKVSITQITSVGDKNSAYLQVNTDYVLPEKFDESTDYILPENSSLNITYKNIFGNQEVRTFGSVFASFYEKGKLGFLISIEGCEEINRCNVELKIENLYWHHDLGKYEENSENETKQLLCKGVWETNWTYSYKSNVRTKHLIKKIETEEGQIYLTKIEVSPISIRLEAVRNPKDRSKSWTMGMLEEITYDDGTSIDVKGFSTGGIKNGIVIESFVNIHCLGKVLRPESVECVKVCGQNVDM